MQFKPGEPVFINPCTFELANPGTSALLRLALPYVEAALEHQSTEPEARELVNKIRAVLSGPPPVRPKCDPAPETPEHEDKP